MKHLSTVIVGLICLVLAVSLFVSKRNDNAQHEQDSEAISSTSNLLFSAQMEAAGCKGETIALSNRLETCQSTSLALSNELVEVKSAHATAKEDLKDLGRQIADLKRQLTQSESQNQASSQRLAVLTSQIAELTNQIASAQANLFQANKDYVLLENRFRRDVAERVIVERKFNNRAALQAQMEYLLWNPAVEISEDRIREGLDVVVKSNLCYVIAPE